MELERQLPKNIQQRPRLAGKGPLDKFEKREAAAREQKRLDGRLAEAAFEGKTRECMLLVAKGAQISAGAELLAASENQTGPMALFNSISLLRERLGEKYDAFYLAFVECAA